MEKILEKLKEALGLAEAETLKAQKLTAEQNDRAKILDARYRELQAKETSFATREEAVSKIEYSIEVLRKNESLVKENQDLNDFLKQEKEKFETWRKGETERIQGEDNRIKKEWDAIKELRG